MAAEDDSDIPDTGAVFTFGKSKFADNLPNKFWVRNDRVLEVACGDEHTALVAESGRVFTFGSNDWGQLGLGTSKTADRPSCIKSLKHEKVNLVSCGRAHTIVATESGKLYSFGANGESQLGIDDTPSCNVPKCIDSLVTQQYTMLSAGVEHSVALTEDGALFVWGGGSEGQLGLGAQKMECPEPEELLIEDVITCVSCGYYHTAFVTESGDLYTYGESDGGKLGLGEDPEDTDTPQKISMPGRVTSVACGGSHTVALTEDGSVYSFGDGQGGQLGHGTTCLQTSTPRKLKVNFKVTTIACGENHTAIISEKGQIYTFGDGRHGKLGSGQDSFSNELVPTKVNRFTKFNVGKISCGGCHMICLAKLRLENGDNVNSEDEAKQEPMMNGMLNHTIDLNNSFTARDRRRKHNDSFKNDLNRTLPALAGAPGLLPDHLHNTVPAVKSRRLEALPTSKHTDVINDRGDNIYNIKKDVQEDLIKAEVQEEVKSSPRPAPRPVQRRLPDPKRNEDADSGSGEEGVSEDEQEMEQTKTLTTPRAPIPPPRPQPKVKGQSESEGEESGESEEKEPEKVEVMKRSKGKEKRPKKKKKQSMGLFGRKKTGISDDEDEGDDDDEADDDEDVREEAPRKLPVIEVRKDVVKAEEGKTKKGKKTEEEEEDDEEEEVEKKDTKKKGKGKKKKKLKKKKEESEEEEEDEEEKEDKTSKVKDEKKGSEDETESEKKGEKSEKEGEKDKEDEKAPEPPKKKSRTCTIL